MEKKFTKLGIISFGVSKCLSVVLEERLCTMAYSSKANTLGLVRHEKIKFAKFNLKSLRTRQCNGK